VNKKRRKEKASEKISSILEITVNLCALVTFPDFSSDK
jgi:hypothetical protein